MYFRPLYCVRTRYNRGVKFLAIALVAVGLAACSKNVQTKDAIRDAVVEYLNAKQEQTGLDMSAMTVEVANVSFQADRAIASVVFNLKAGPGSMRMTYTLERQGNKWVVRDTKAGGSPETPALPPDHPAVGGGGGSSSGELPSGHPPVGSTK